nr:MAG TPA_asm: Xin repeat protein [Caudoviricetes sp.]
MVTETGGGSIQTVGLNKVGILFRTQPIDQ